MKLVSLNAGVTLGIPLLWGQFIVIIKTLPDNLVLVFTGRGLPIPDLR